MVIAPDGEPVRKPKTAGITVSKYQKIKTSIRNQRFENPPKFQQQSSHYEAEKAP
jgi:hypothetical protein